jgi:hypothetical protein
MQAYECLRTDSPNEKDRYDCKVKVGVRARAYVLVKRLKALFGIFVLLLGSSIVAGSVASSIVS